MGQHRRLHPFLWLVSLGVCGQSCPALGVLGHLDLQVLVLVQVTGSIPRLLGAKACAADLPEEGRVLLLPAEPEGRAGVTGQQESATS